MRCHYNRKDKGSVDVAYDDALIIMNEEKRVSVWVLDSTFFSHICSHREWFSSYQPIERKVFLGNNTIEEVKGIDTIVIKTTNGLTKVLIDVRHVSRLRRSVISMVLHCSE